jgi:hypothetical protein
VLVEVDGLGTALQPVGDIGPQPIVAELVRNEQNAGQRHRSDHNTCREGAISKYAPHHGGLGEIDNHDRGATASRDESDC